MKAHLVSGTIVLLFLVPGLIAQKMRPLLGGSLQWNVDKDFGAQTNPNRVVTLTLYSAFETDPLCTYTAGTNVMCNAYGNGVAGVHGILCVRTIVSDASGKLTLGNTYPGTDQRCPYLWSKSANATFRPCTYFNDVLCTGYENSGIELSSQPTIGVENDFQVITVQNSDDPTQTSRKLNRRSVVFGVKSHSILVGSGVIGLVAYLTTVDGNPIDVTQGILLPRCVIATISTGQVNLCSHTTRFFRDAAGNKLSYSFASLNDVYWRSSLLAQFPGLKDLDNLSPALETYIPLCTTISNDWRCTKNPINNYFAPVSGLPYLIEVPITPKTLYKSKTYKTSSNQNFNASQPPISVPIYDFDGHMTTFYSPGFTTSVTSDKAMKCWLGSTNDTVRACPTCPYDWPNKICTHAQSYNESSTLPREQGIKYPTLGKVCTSDSECVYTNSRGESIQGWCNSTWSTCRQMFDFDRNGYNSAGRFMKFDFDWVPVQSITANFDEYVYYNFTSNRQSLFTQHALAAVDFPFIDIDNPLDASGKDILEDHYYKVPAFLDPTTSLFKKAFQASGSSQQIFSTFPCYAGSLNQPPEFYTSLDITTATKNLVREVVCNYAVTCRIDLFALDFPISADGTEDKTRVSSDSIRIESALGNGDKTWTCVGTGSLQCTYTLDTTEKLLTEGYLPSVQGKIITRCFVAYDVHDTTACQQQGARCTCRSLPYCVKFKFQGNPPAFDQTLSSMQAPQSYDDNGILVPQRMDIFACSGTPIQLNMSATDPDSDDVRIFVLDPDNDRELPDGISNYIENGGRWNANFFSSAALQTLPNNCGSFQGYGATRVGNNSAQTTLAPVQRNLCSDSSCGQVKTLYSSYATNIEVVKKPYLSVAYTLDLVKGDGLSSLLQNCGQSCREVRSNVDQLVCAAAYDNSRLKYGRWVGETDPNGDDKYPWQRLHDNGDQVSQQVCWKIRLQAPPVFVTDAGGVESPFDQSWLERTKSAFAPTSINGEYVEAAYKRIRIAANESKTVTFVAQDPEPLDRIKIFLLENPGAIKNIQVSRSTCIPRLQDSAMCRAADVINPSVYPKEKWTSPLLNNTASSCSRARRLVEYNPLPEDAGKAYRVCMTARDDSTGCANRGIRDATVYGWYSEVHCVVFEVVLPQLTWRTGTSNLFTQVDAFVGCRTQLLLQVDDKAESTRVLGAYTGNYPLLIETDGLPDGAVLTPSTPPTAGCLLGTSQCTTSSELIWIPQRGMEGLAFKVCLQARDVFGIRSLGLACSGGPQQGAACGWDGDCGGGTCSLRMSCVSLNVVRCRYCFEAQDTLIKVMRSFASDMNWLRIWALNGNDNGGNSTRIHNPDEVVSSRTDGLFFVGVTYQTKRNELLADVASRFRTTVKTILSLNWDITQLGAGDHLPAGQELCLIPCSTLPS